MKVVEPCNDGEEAAAACGDKPPEDCVLTDWQEWSICTLECGGGQKERKRTVAREPSYGGKPCNNTLVRTEPCNTKLCSPIHCQDCVWGDWSDWGDCSRCGGQKFRHRSIAKMPNECGRVCHPESAKEVASCKSHCETTKYCVWTPWSSSSSCGTGCGASTSVRNRIMTLTDAPGDNFLFKGLESSSCSATQLNVSACPLSSSCRTQCIPRNCQFAPWSDWHEPSCVGLCERHRVVAVMNNECGHICDGSLLETKTCRADCQIPVDCQLSPWTDWEGCLQEDSAVAESALSEAVPDNQKVRTREVIQRPKNGGKPCTGNLREMEACGSVVIADCTLSDWGAWGSCSKSCGRGWKMRMREVLAPAQGGGSQCHGRLEELTGCGLEYAGPQGYKAAACVSNSHDCELEDWSDWSGLDGDSQRYRSRKVAVPASSGGKACSGSLHETETAHAERVDCRTSDWTFWDNCDRTCGGGQQRRQRQVSRFPANGGTTCPHELMQTQGCNTEACSKQDAELGEWTKWSTCSASCGPAMQERKRMVLTIRGPGGAGASASLGQTRACANNLECDLLDCLWADWQAWSACTCTCGGGQRTRDRMVKRMPSDGGRACTPEEKEQIEPCNTQRCSSRTCIDGAFGGWSAWGMCSATCGGGVSIRHRPIVTEANECGTPVEGKDRETKFCNVDINCEAAVDCVLQTWGPWSDCSGTCSGIQRRSRVVEKYGRGDGAWCMGALKETRPCNPTVGAGAPTGCGNGPVVDCIFASWGAWSTCSATCGGGMHERSRRVAKEAETGGKACNGTLSEIRECGRNDCIGPEPQDCKFGDWQAWGACSKCSGQRFRYRNIVQYAENGGLNCNDGDSQQATSCPRQCHTASYCVWTMWEDWQRCSANCGTGGKRTRRRYLEITSDTTQAVNQLTPAEELLKKYSTLYIKTQELRESHLQDLLVAFGAGSLSLLALLGFGVWLTRRSSRMPAASQAISRALGMLPSESRQLPVSAERRQGGARYQSVAEQDLEDDEDDDVGVEMSVRGLIRS